MHARTLIAAGLFASGTHAWSEVVTMEKVQGKSGACTRSDNETDCSIGIVVTEMGEGAARQCTVQLENAENHETVGIRRLRPVWLRWFIKTRPIGYVFELDGIEFIRNLPPRQFVWPSISADRQEYSWRNLNNRGIPDYYEYVINVRNSDGSVRCFLDPWIKNQ